MIPSKIPSFFDAGTFRAGSIPDLNHMVNYTIIQYHYD